MRRVVEQRRWTATVEVLLAACLIAWSSPALASAEAEAADTPAGGGVSSRHAVDREVSLGRRWSMTVIPRTDLYPRYVADPRRARFAITRMSFSSSGIAAAGDTRLGLRMGGRYGFFRFHSKGAPDRGFQIDLEAGFMGQFDVDNSTDNIGWDGYYGLQLAWASRCGVALRTGVFHDSSHVGDEYIESTGRGRIDYTREEYLLGVSYAFVVGLRVYGEGGYAFDLRNEELQEPGRLQYGLEYDSPLTLWGRRMGWYAAVDLSFFEEDDWEDNVTVQAGLYLPVEDLARNYRIGLEYYDGRSQIGEFFWIHEEYVAFGIWFDL
jgi:hypothetical protein